MFPSAQRSIACISNFDAAAVEEDHALASAQVFASTNGKILGPSSSSAAGFLPSLNGFSSICDAKTKSHGSVDNFVLQLPAAYLSGTELTLFKGLVTSMNSSANSGKVKIFDTSSKSVDKCNFRLGVVNMVNESIALKMWVLSFKFGTQDVTFRRRHQAMTPNEAHYAQVHVRQAVKDKLGANRPQSRTSGSDLRRVAPTIKRRIYPVPARICG
ncbi:hypothetical protein B0H13DRAFT_1853056 [Mycena leptocephala]|nr:hypothetical protein B0H13DRAFT_1853056 [Mycena leptocephala]